MRRRALFALITAAMGLLVSGRLRAQAPSEDWRTIETAHFRVHYPASFSAWAARAAASLEGVHARVEEFVGFTPPRRIDVLVSDPAADANGIAFPFLDRPRIELWATPPDPESGLGEFRDWTELLVTHEYAHIVHLTRPRNRPGALGRILPIPFGPVFFHSPRWVAEGYATVVEGALTGSGRPSSVYRAMVLRRFAAEGKLPSYGALDGTSGWLGGSMAYLVGSSFLEWLEARGGPGSLRRLWKRMASRSGGSFSEAFRGVFGRPAPDLYDRFRAEVTAKSIEQEKELVAAGLAEGEKWQRLEGGTASLEVSPDGKRLLAARSPRRGKSLLAIWELGEPSSPKERQAEERRKARERARLSDPNEVADVPESPLARAPRWTLPRQNGRSPEDPRWMPDGRRVLFGMRQPGPDGVLHRDLFLWEPETGAVTRQTRFADLFDADPGSDGASAVAVRGRYGRSELVRVDLPTGRTGRTVVLASAPSGDPWQVWSHPRLSPDGSRIAALLHREGRWRVVILPAKEGAGDAPLLEIAMGGGAVGSPEWSADGRTLYAATDEPGVWALAAIDPDAPEVSGRAPGRILTRVTGGAFSPAPEPGGEGLFFLELTGKGVDVHRLRLPAAELSLGVSRLPPVVPASAAEEKPLVLSPPGPEHPYRVLDTQVVRLFSAFTAGPDGFSTQAGAEGSDVVGKLDWIAAGALGNAAGPRGGTVALAWSGWPVILRAQAFSALERPGSQRLTARPELDTERRGGALSLSWQRMLSGGRIRAEAWAAAMRVDALATDSRFSRSLAGAKAQGDWRRFRGKTGIAIRGEAAGSAGSTDGHAWSWASAAVGLRGSVSGVDLSVTGRAGRAGGSPTDLDLFAIGGASSTIVPAGVDANRMASPALPTGAQLGRRFEGFRAEISGSGSPVLLYAERWRAWSPSPRPEPIRLEGIELRLERLIPLDLPESLSLYAGIARVRSRHPRFDSIRGYGGLVYRP